ncbi:MAG: zf-HC2 domain-containing protein [Pseudomonadota bacterium]
MRPTSPSPRQRLLALFGVLWSNAETRPLAPCPPQTHIAALFDGKLDADQAAEVRAHLATCPHCYRSLLHLSEVADLIDDAAPAPLARRHRLFTRLGGLGIAAALLLTTATLLQPLLRPADWTRTMEAPYATLRGAVVEGRHRPSATGWIWRPGYSARGLGLPDTARTRVARAALTSGVAQGLDAVTSSLEPWMPVRGELSAAAALSCEDLPERECASITEFHQDVGRWAVLMHFACEPLRGDGLDAAGADTWVDRPFWQDATDTLSAIAKQSARLTPDDAYARLFANWSTRADANEPATLCRGVPPLLSTLTL